MKILGISAYYHDAAAALIEHGEIVAAVQEERFTRKKNDPAFPEQSIRYCLQEAGLKLSEVDAVVFYDKPFLKFERLLDSNMTGAPRSWLSFITSMPVWLKEKLFLKSSLKKSLKQIDPQIDWKKTEILFSLHHLSHAASSFFVSGFPDAAILTIDGVGEWATASIAHGSGNQIAGLSELRFPDSLGLLYSAFTQFLGFEVNSGEYKVMGLAPYANPEDRQVQDFLHKMRSEMATVHEDGSLRLNQQYFGYTTSLHMIRERKLEQLFGFPKRKPEDQLSKQHFSLACALQAITEEIVLKMARQAQKLTGSKNICLAGGVALNCVANGKLLESGLYQNIFIQPASGDSGGALGAALAAYHMHYGKPRHIEQESENMKMSKLGPAFSDQQVVRALERAGLPFTELDADALVSQTAKTLQEGKTGGWFQGRMELGPRALGSRSILGNPLLPETQSTLNLKVKKRESFRPFAPVMLKDEFERFFGQTHDSKYMLLVHKILPQYRKGTADAGDDIIQKINQVRSVLPSITHVDYTARIQTVDAKSDPKLFKLLKAFQERTGFGVLVNTSFNIKDEPIVCTPEDAIKCFLGTDIDFLVMNNYLVTKPKNA